MATATKEKLENLLECPICLERIDHPKAFECLHFFCQKCIDDLKPIAEGIECPCCRQVTPQNKLRNIHFINELLDIVRLTDQKNLCDTCKKDVAEWRCLDCKEVFCIGCKKGHDKLSILKNHKWIAVKEGEQLVVDKHVFCERHPDKHVELHCRQCKQLICMLCRGTEHHTHEAETIQDAIDYMVPLVQQNIERIRARSEANVKIKHTMETAVIDAKKAYKNIEKEIDDKRNELVRKIDDEIKSLKNQLDSTQKKHINHIKEGITALDVRIKTEKNILNLGETTINTAQGTSLIQALQGGLNDTIVNHLATEHDMPAFQCEPKVQFSPITYSNDRFIGIIREKETKPKGIMSMMISQPLSEIAAKHYKFIDRKKIPYSTRLSKVEDSLWCVEWDTSKIHVYSNDGVLKKTLELKDITNIYAAIQVQPSVVIASKQGIYLTDINGQHSRNLAKGEYCDVSAHGDYLFALNNNEGRIFIVKHINDEQSYYIQKEITIPDYSGSYSNTIQATLEFLYVAQLRANNILQLRHDGTLVATHDAAAVVRLRYPRLSGVDPAESLLIADAGNKRLLVLKKNWDFQCMDVKKSILPFGAVFDGYNIYMVGFDGTNNCFARFSAQT